MNVLNSGIERNNYEAVDRWNVDVSSASQFA
jgi:hypothetical protein